MRLIDADALKEADFQDFSNTDVMNAIDNAPTIDAEPVVRGEWVTTRTIIHDGEPYCSLCGQEALTEYGRRTYIKSNYCPNCGVKMDRESESNA
jgi:predicted RNA-binding Zn-ribbon protein involved in translation (DUF1610 family)